MIDNWTLKGLKFYFDHIKELLGSRGAYTSRPNWTKWSKIFLLIDEKFNAVIKKLNLAMVKYWWVKRGYWLWLGVGFVRSCLEIIYFFLPNLMSSGLWENPINKKETIKFLKSLKQHEIINDSCCSFWIYL